MEYSEAIFNFPDQQALTCQSRSVCKELYEHFCTTLSHKYPESTKVLSDIRRRYHVHWVPRYGCAVLSSRVRAGTMNLTMVGLDNWERKIHESKDGRESIAVADSLNPTVLFIGEHPESMIVDLLRNFDATLTQSESGKGNQKTPSYASEILRGLMNGEDDSTCQKSTQGGTTDVGQHTGCIARNTSFPLVLASLYTMLQRNGVNDFEELLTKFVIWYYLHHLVSITDELTMYDRAMINRAIVVIREIEKWMFLLHDKDFKESVFKSIEACHDHLESLEPDILAEKDIDPNESVSATIEGLRIPNFPTSIPTQCPDTNGADRLQLARNEAERNLAKCQLSIQDSFSGDIRDAWVQLAKLNEFLWHAADGLVSSEARCDKRFVADLRSKLDLYSPVIQVAQDAASKTPHLMSVVFRSYEALAIYICFCWADRVARAAHPVYKKYSPALDPKLLEYLVLDDSRAILALKQVHQYLDTQASECRSDIPFRTVKGTLALALEYGKSSSECNDLYSRELDHSKELIELRFAEISAKKAKLEELDVELSRAQEALKLAKRETIRARNDSQRSNKYIRDPTYKKAAAHENFCKSVVVDLEMKIESQEIRPPNLVLALPRDKDTALEWLFFLYMPKELRDVSALAHQGQTQFWETNPESINGETDLLAWFNSRKSFSKSTSKVEKLYAVSLQKMPQLRVPKNIRSYGEESGVFFPDCLRAYPTWKEGDPFGIKIDGYAAATLFSEKLPDEDPGNVSLQKFVPMDPSETRGNTGIARRDNGNKPDWLSTEEYLHFSTLRSYPRTQIRKFLVALEDELLPFENACVHTLVKQLLFQVGDASWKLDLSHPWHGLPRLLKQMERHADLLRESPSNSSKLSLFGVISGFLGQWDNENPSSAREFAKVARNWGDRVKDEIDALEQVPPAVYGKQARYYGYALLCHGIGRREEEDYLEIAELSVLYRASRMKAGTDFECTLLDQPVAHVMATRIDKVIEAVQCAPNKLTECLSNVIAGFPRNLSWNSFGPACFEAVYLDHSYYVNILNGIVLVDGAPPGFLPDSVVSDTLYRRTFENRTFEIIPQGFQHYQTTRSFGEGIMYEFLFDSNQQLVIVEKLLETGSGLFDEGSTLVLLRQETLDLPGILKEKHSHWYSTLRRAVFVRGTFYRERSIRYIMTRHNTFAMPSEVDTASLDLATTKTAQCWRLMLGETGISRILSRIEGTKFIHVFVNPELTALRYSLPRCTLLFEQTDDSVASMQFSGFCLRQNQQLDGLLVGITSYLVLSDQNGNEKVLTPDGKIPDGGNVGISEDLRHSSGYFSYDVHGRFGNLISLSRLSRLHLAAMHAASSTFLLEKKHHKTGFSIATKLLLHCWTNEPLSEAETLKLMEVSEHSSLSCTLRLACSMIFFSSNSVRFLHALDELGKIQSLEHDVLAVDKYLQIDGYEPRLPSMDEAFILGIRRRECPRVPLAPRPKSSKIVHHVQNAENFLRDCLVETPPNIQGVFPFQQPIHAEGLEKDFFFELRTNWDDATKLPAKIAQRVSHERTAHIQLKTKDMRAQIESWLMKSIADEKLEARLSRISGRLAVASQIDLLSMSWDESLLTSFNSSLGTNAAMEFRHKVVGWMMLCVLEDRLERIGQLNDLHALQAELDCIREWNPFLHPRWIAFEVEQRLQIRPHQFTIVQQLLSDRGTCTQLNMGLGKTRVLLPMLILELAQTKKEVVRVNVLSSIFHDGLDYFRTALVASVQQVRVFTLPFNRDISLDEYHSRLLTEEMARCKESVGCLFVTPQHRNSLVLKQWDDDGIPVIGLKQPFADILDESDAILDPLNQLVYSVGTQTPLQGGPSRWNMFEALLKIIARSTCEDLVNVFSDPDLTRRESPRLGSFPEFRFLEPSLHKEKEVRTALCRQLFCGAHVPYELKSLKKLSQELQELLVEMITDPKYPDVLTKIRSDPMLVKLEDDILAARGCLAHGTIFHGLHARYRVKYGLDQLSLRKMAVPYSACDTPKPRATYSHPDMAILYTCLSYYYEGLNATQFREALTRLLQSGPVKKEAIYDEWILSIQADVAASELKKFDNVLKIDLDNMNLLTVMHANMRRSMEVVSFWMNHFVFPQSTAQFPKLRSTSAWNLVDNRRAVGFSGTNDTRFLLPLDFIKQNPPNDARLRCVDGEMLDLIIRCTKEVVLLEGADGGCNTMLWKTIVHRSLHLGTSALIDAGGLMAGSSNREVAFFMASLIHDDFVNQPFRGIVYYDPIELKSWAVYEMENARYIDLKSSSLSESECFVYFDQSRCRGADLKLRIDAVALLTLEPNMRKDVLLQGAKRMRQLRPDGQSLILGGTSEFLARDMTTKEVLEKILHSTIRMIRQGTATFLDRGRKYCAFPDAIEQHHRLAEMYAKECGKYNDLRDYLDSEYEIENMSGLEQKLVKFCREVGKDVGAHSSSLVEECEQEVEKEVEEEAEEEVENPSEDPYAERDWAYEDAFTNPDSLFKTTFLRVSKLIRYHLADLTSVRWHPNMYCTENFWRTIDRHKSCSDMSNYLRPVDAMLTYRDGRVVLLSEYDTDKLLPYWRDRGNVHVNDIVCLQHLSVMASLKPYMKDGLGGGDMNIKVEPNVLTSIKLFRGYVHYTEAECEYIRDVMFRSIPTSARKEIRNLLSCRGRSRHFERSDLDDYFS